MATIIVCAVVLLLIALVAARIVKDKRAGKSSCGCNCDCCAMRGACHKKQ